MILGEKTIVIRPQSEHQVSERNEEALPLVVEVNGQEIRLQPTERKVLGESTTSTEIKMRRDMEIEINAPKFGLRVISSGRRMKVCLLT